MKRTTVIAIASSMALAALAVVAYQRSGLLGLPDVPDELTAEAVGLPDLESLKTRQAKLLEADTTDATPEDHLTVAARGFSLLDEGEPEKGLDLLEQAVEMVPDDLVIGNALRMEILRLKRRHRNAKTEVGSWDELPPWLEGRPVDFFRQLAERRSEPEVRLQIAASLLDDMLLFPALEVRAGITVEAMEVLQDLLREDGGNPYYLPALYARGLVYLHRPANLLWTERIDSVLRAAENDLALCVAIGRRVGTGTDKIRARLALSLGDTYAKEGENSRARSWWQIADAVGNDPEIRSQVVERMGWRDYEVLDRLEAVLEQNISNLDQPLSDMSVLWQ